MRQLDEADGAGAEDPARSQEGGANEAPPNASWVRPETTQECHDQWMKKLDEGDLSGVPISVDCFIPVRGSVVESNVRGTEDYKGRCCEAVGH